MPEIKTSKNAVKYAPVILKTGKLVYSQAILQRIPHNDPNKVDIALKIGRYKQPYDELEKQRPKSELTLNNDELNSLIDYLAQFYKPIEMNANSFITIENDSAELIRSFKKLIHGNTDIARLLIENDILTDNIYIAASVIKKQQALTEFESMLLEDLEESKWQKWFENNKWILGSDFSEIIDERRIDTEHIADYLMKAFDGFIDLIEIKRPGGDMKFWSSNKDHDNYIPSTELIKAITQCLNYISQIEQEANSQKFVERVQCKVIKPRCLLIFGRSNTWDNKHQESYRILNAAYNQISIITYDQLLERAKNSLYI